MIKPIKFPFEPAFRANLGEQQKTINNNQQQTQTESQNTINTQNSAPECATKPLTKFQLLKHKTLDFLKGFNNVTNTTQGAVKGVVEGAVATTVVGVIGKNIKESEGQISGTLLGIGKDITKGLKHAVGFIPSLLTKSPVENLKNVVTLPKKFYGKGYLNVLNKAGEGATSHKGTAAIATLVGVGVLALRTIQGKISANEKNADLDHKTNHGHVK